MTKTTTLSLTQTEKEVLLFSLNCYECELSKEYKDNKCIIEVIGYLKNRIRGIKSED